MPVITGPAENAANGRVFAVHRPAEGSDLFCSTVTGRRAAVVSGRLRRGPQDGALSAQRGPIGNDAELVLRHYLEGGTDACGRLRGRFAAVIWDGDNDLLIAVRDPMGIHPLFWADTPAALVLSDDVDTLLAAPGVGTDWNRAAVVDHLRGHRPDPEETLIAGVRRVPAGHALVARATRVATTRVWGPVWAQDPRPEQQGTGSDFDGIFREAVKRCLHPERTAILLSGGLDSVSIATAMAELVGDGRSSPPLALAMHFPYPEADEESTQREVARRLGFSLVMADVTRLAAPAGVLQATLELAHAWPVPVTGPWLAPYLLLARDAVEEDCSVILSGWGADEWLVPSPYHAADLMAQRDIGGLLRLVAAARRSSDTSLPLVLRSYGWDHGLRALLVRALLGTPSRPWIQRAHRLRLDRATPPWLAPDPSLRRELDARVKTLAVRSHLSAHHRMEQIVDPWVSMQLEELHQLGRELGRPTLCPFLDNDLIELVGRLSASNLNYGVRWKGLLRQTLSRRFPDLGFDRQKKRDAGPTYTRLLEHEGRALWQSQRAPLALSRLGIVDAKLLEIHAEGVLRDGGGRARAGLFRLQLLEAYVAARLGP